MAAKWPQPNPWRGRPRRRGFAGWQSHVAILWVVLVLGFSAGAETAPFPEYQPATAREYLGTLIRAIEDQAGSGADTRFLQARLEQQLGRQDEAERLARQALALDGSHPDIPSFLADLCVRQDRLEEAARWLRDALRLDPQLPGGDRRLGMVLDRLGDPTGAREAFARAIAIVPDDATARLLLGRLLLDQGNAKDALVHLEKASRLDPELANAFYVLAEAQIRLGDLEGARQNRRIFQQLKTKEKAAMDQENARYDDAGSLRITTAGFHLDAADLLLRQRQDALAETHLRQALRVAPREPRGYETLAAYYRKAGRLTEAREPLDELARLRPRQASDHLNLGTLLLQLKEYPAAVAELRRALELDAQSPEALNNLARYYLGARRELPEALALCRRLVAGQPTAAHYDLLGWALYANGFLDEARAASDQAVEKEPASAVYRERNRRLKQLP